MSFTAAKRNLVCAEVRQRGGAAAGAHLSESKEIRSGSVEQFSSELWASAHAHQPTDRGAMGTSSSCLDTLDSPSRKEEMMSNLYTQHSLIQLSDPLKAWTWTSKESPQTSPVLALICISWLFAQREVHGRWKQVHRVVPAHHLQPCFNTMSRFTPRRRPSNPEEASPVNEQTGVWQKPNGRVLSRCAGGNDDV